jgi:hypothetical protein
MIGNSVLYAELAEPGHSSDSPSRIDLAAIRVNTTESRFVASLNRLLQQNLQTTDLIAPALPPGGGTSQWSGSPPDRIK